MNNNKLSSTPSVSSVASSKRSIIDSASYSPTTQTASTARNITSPTPPPPCTRACSPHTPPGTPPSRGSPSPVSIQVPTSDVTTGTCEIPLQTLASTETASQPRTTPLHAWPITEDYIAGINQIDLGPRVNDLSKL